MGAHKPQHCCSHPRLPSAGCGRDTYLPLLVLGYHPQEHSRRKGINLHWQASAGTTGAGAGQWAERPDPPSPLSVNESAHAETS